MYISTSHILKAVPLVTVNTTSTGLCSNPVIKETLRTTLAAFSSTWYESGVNPIVMSKGKREEGWRGRVGEGGRIEMERRNKGREEGEREGREGEEATNKWREIRKGLKGVRGRVKESGDI